jgi:hypothetical protein
MADVHLWNAGPPTAKFPGAELVRAAVLAEDESIDAAEAIWFCADAPGIVATAGTH